MSTLTDTLNVFPLSNFTLSELMLINSAVIHYINDDRIDSLKESLLSKISDDMRWRSYYLARVAMTRATSEDGSQLHQAKLVDLHGRIADDIAVETNPNGKTPVLKFLLCPEVLSLQSLGQNNIGNSIVLEWVKGSHESRTGVRISCEGGEEDTSFTASSFHMELLIAFYIYHSLRSRGVDLSGTPTTAPPSEG